MFFSRATYHATESKQYTMLTLSFDMLDMYMYMFRPVFVCQFIQPCSCKMNKIMLKGEGNLKH